MKSKKVKIDYTNFNPDKEYTIKNEKVKLSNNKLIASVTNLLNNARPDLGGKIGGKVTKELGIGIHGLSKEERIENANKGGKLGGKKTKELGIGIHGLSDENRIENSSKAGSISWEINKDKNFGIHGLSAEERKLNAIKGNQSRKTLGTPPKTPIECYKVDTNEFVGTYISISECARQLGIDKGNIHKVLKGMYKQHKGYIFKNKS